MQARHSLLLALRDEDGLAGKGQKIGLINRQDLACSAPLLAVLESPLLFSLMEELTVRSPMSDHSHNWLVVKAPSRTPFELDASVCFCSNAHVSVAWFGWRRIMACHPCVSMRYFAG